MNTLRKTMALAWALTLVSATAVAAASTPAPSATSHSSRDAIRPAGTGGINLAWMDCGLAGTLDQSFSCSSTSGPFFTLVGSFVPPAGVDEFMGMIAEVTIRTADGSNLPDWWKHGASECRDVHGLRVSWDFVNEGPNYTCALPYEFPSGSHTYEVGYGGPDRARLRLSATALPSERGPLTAGTEYYAFKAHVTRSRSFQHPVGTVCEGCDVPMNVTLNSIQLLQPPERAYDPVLTEAWDRNFVTWQQHPLDAPPTIERFTPTSGGPGTVVTIYGVSLIGATSVTFGTLPAASFGVVDDHRIDATAPSGVRSGPITVTTAHGSATTSESFSVGTFGGGEINLSWDDCGTFGSLDKSFACDSSNGFPFTLVASFHPPAGIDEFVGISSQIFITSSTPSLPDWWKHGSGQCRGTTSLLTSVDFINEGPYSCVDPWAGRGFGAYAYDVAYQSANRARLRVQYAIPPEDRGPLEGFEHYAYKVRFTRAKSAGAGACAGCDEKMQIVLDYIQLLQSVESNNDPILYTPRDRNYVTWQHDGIVAVLASVVATEVTTDRVRLEWHSDVAPQANVYRRAKDGVWIALGRASSPSEHRFVYEDRDVMAGATYAYRLGLHSGGAEVFAGEIEVTVPATALGIERIGWSRDARAATLSLSLPGAGRASVEIFDVHGRRTGSLRLDVANAGIHEVRVPIFSSLRGGVYFARVTHGNAHVERRFVVVQ